MKTIKISIGIEKVIATLLFFIIIINIIEIILSAIKFEYFMFTIKSLTFLMFSTYLLQERINVKNIVVKKIIHIYYALLSFITFIIYLPFWVILFLIISTDSIITFKKNVFRWNDEKWYA